LPLSPEAGARGEQTAAAAQSARLAYWLKRALSARFSEKNGSEDRFLLASMPKSARIGGKFRPAPARRPCTGSLSGERIHVAARQNSGRGEHPGRHRLHLPGRFRLRQTPAVVLRRLPPRLGP